MSKSPVIPVTHRAARFAILLIALSTLPYSLAPTTGTSRSLAGARPAERDSPLVAQSAPDATPTVPQFGPIRFAEDVADDGSLIQPSEFFSGNAPAIWAFFTYDHVASETAWRRELLKDGRVLFSVDEPWIRDSSGWAALPLSDGVPIPAGHYVFNLYLRGQLVQQAFFAVQARSDYAAPLAAPAAFGAITFCRDYTDDGKPIGATDRFPAGTTRVLALFTYSNMVRGQAWGRIWQKDGVEYVNRGNETWDKDANGYSAYSLDDEEGLETGHYTLTLLLGGRRVQQASFDVGTGSQLRPATASASFGPITFSSDIDAGEPVGAGNQFPYGIRGVYAVFPYAGMLRGLAWATEWLKDDRPWKKSDRIWDRAETGSTFTYAYTEGDNYPPLPRGKYTLNLYIAGRLARSASFQVTVPPTLQPPARPQDVIDAKLLPYWQALTKSKSAKVREMAQMATKYRIPIRLETFDWALAYYQSGDRTLCNIVPGHVGFSRAYYGKAAAVDISSSIVHELTHAWQALENGMPCTCTIEKEYNARYVEILWYTDRGRLDLAKQLCVTQCFDSQGKFDGGLLWRHVKSIPGYEDCRAH